MMGHTHVCCGLAAGAALTYALPGVDSLASRVAVTAVVGGMALLPDLDHPRATVSRTWGPVTYLASKVVCFLGRGHRGGTHDPLLAPLIAAGLAWAASQTFWTSVAMVALAAGLALRGCHFVIPGQAEKSWPINLAASWAVGWFAVEHAVDMWWLPIAVATGVAIHIAGDWMTYGQVPKPFSWLDGRDPGEDFGPRMFRTGSWVETVLAWLLVGATVALLYLGAPEIREGGHGLIQMVSS